MNDITFTIHPRKSADFSQVKSVFQTNLERQVSAPEMGHCRNLSGMSTPSNSGVNSPSLVWSTSSVTTVFEASKEVNISPNSAVSCSTSITGCCEDQIFRPVPFVRSRGVARSKRPATDREFEYEDFRTSKETRKNRQSMPNRLSNEVMNQLIPYNCRPHAVSDPAPTSRAPSPALVRAPSPAPVRCDSRAPSPAPSMISSRSRHGSASPNTILSFLTGLSLNESSKVPNLSLLA